VWLFVLALVGTFRALRKRFPESDRPVFRAWMYGLAVVALWVALDWPVGALGAGYLASVHMVQYLLIALIAPPLLLMGLPRGLFQALTRGRARPVVSFLSHPIPAMIVFVSIMAWTHWPPVVDTLMVTQSGSFLLDLLWLFSGVVFWWPVAAPLPARSWLHEPGKVGYLIVATLVNTGVFAYLTFSPLPLYATYELAPPVTGLTTRDDQLVAGLLMKMGGAVILWTAITVIFFRWYRQSEEKERTARGAVAVLLIGATSTLAGCSPDGAGSGGEVRASQSPVVEARGAVMAVPVSPGRSAIYLDLVNGTPSAARLTGGRLVVGADTLPVSIHRTSMDGGIMRMAPIVDGLPLDPGSTEAFRPGGLHLMVEGLPESLAPGAVALLELELADGSRTRPSGVRVVSLADLDAAVARELGPAD
jgi:putative membrane protein